MKVVISIIRCNWEEKMNFHVIQFLKLISVHNLTTQSCIKIGLSVQNSTL